MSAAGEGAYEAEHVIKVLVIGDSGALPLACVAVAPQKGVGVSWRHHAAHAVNLPVQGSARAAS